MKLKNILFLMLVVVLASCKGTIHGGGAVVVPILLGLGALACWIVTAVGYFSGTRHQSQTGDGGPQGWKEDKGKKAPTGYLVFAIILTLALGGYYLIQYFEK